MINRLLTEAVCLPPLYQHTQNSRKMRKPNYQKAQMNATNDIYEGQSIERFVEQAETTNQPIDGSAPEIYTARKDGVRPEYDVRTDRFQLAQDAMGKASASVKAQRDEFINKQSTNETKETAGATE